MELKRGKGIGKAQYSDDFISLLYYALTERLLKVPAMLRNFLMFTFTHLLLKTLRLGQQGISLGRNVRIQSLKTLSTIGHEASIRIEDHSIVFENARLEAVDAGQINIGECGVLGDCRISARNSVSIGRRFISSWNVLIQDYDSHPVEHWIRAEQVKRICRRFYPRFASPRPEVNEELLAQWRPSSAPIWIGDDVWVGANATILKGSRIGSGCTIASGSTVVAGDYPPGSVLAGNPARVVRQVSAVEGIK
ncbi:MAG: hypothetical protein RI932_2334 [Pseudomonadota bacterium]|jgi:acetyltransferase-like isoleucine patch superfamily enzyme